VTDSPPSPRAGAGRRDRRGRGLRGPLAPVTVPLAQTRAQLFDELVLDAVERLQQRLPDLARVEIAVEDVPPVTAVRADEPIPLGRAQPPAGEHPGRLVLYRRTIELRAPGDELREELVHDVVAELVADLFGLTPEQVDPDYGTED
jgi:predicted Zn-dependent protease with MMP-like domain